MLSTSCKDKTRDSIVCKDLSHHKTEHDSQHEAMHFLGLLGSNNIVRMRLFSFKSSLEGSYQYDNHQDSLFIKGYRNKDSIVLTEYYNGKRTGVLKATLNDKSILKGIWISPEKNKMMPFKLSALSEIDKYQVDKKTCDIAIYLSEDNLYMIQSEKDKVGRYTYTTDNKSQSIALDNISGAFYNDTIIIQNYGNSMNSYTHFDTCDLKYITFVKMSRDHF